MCHFLGILLERLEVLLGSIGAHFINFLLIIFGKNGKILQLSVLDQRQIFIFIFEDFF